MEKTIKIQVPEGYDDVKFNKETNQIEFIKKDNRPKSWEEYCKQVKHTDCYISIHGMVTCSNRLSVPRYNEFDTREEAEAFIALGKLIQLRKSWIGDWKPDWKDDTCKYVIEGYSGKISTNFHTHAHMLLSFPTKDLRDEFLNIFRDLIEEAKILL